MADAKAIVTQAAQKYGIDPKILWGLYGTETSFGKNVSTSSAGAVGPFQFEPATAKSLGVNPYDFKSAAFGAARYLAQYKGRGVGGMLSAYNAGPGGGYQAGYVSTTLRNAASYGGGPVPVPASAGSAATAQKVAGATTQANPKAAGYAQLAKLLRSEGEGTLAGVVEAKGAPTSLPRTAGGSTGASEGTPAPPSNAVKVPPPIKVNVRLPGGVTPAELKHDQAGIAQAKSALERAAGHPVSRAELEKEVEAGTAGKHAVPIAQTPQGTVHQTPAGPIFMPKRR